MAAMLETPVSEPMESFDEAVASKAHLEALQAELKLGKVCTKHSQLCSMQFDGAA